MLLGLMKRCWRGGKGEGRRNFCLFVCLLCFHLFDCFFLLWIDYFRIFFCWVGSEVESRKSMCDVKCPTIQRSYVKNIYVHNAFTFVKKYCYFAKTLIHLEIELCLEHKYIAQNNFNAREFFYF